MADSTMRVKTSILYVANYCLCVYTRGFTRFSCCYPITPTSAAALIVSASAAIACTCSTVQAKNEVLTYRYH